MEVNINEQKPNKIKSFFKNIWDHVLKVWDKFSEWMDRGNKTTVIFLFPYVLMFLVFIVLPIIIAIALSFTYFNGISSPSFVGFDNYIYIYTRFIIYENYYSEYIVICDSSWTWWLYIIILISLDNCSITKESQNSFSVNCLFTINDFRYCYVSIMEDNLQW